MKNFVVRWSVVIGIAAVLAGCSGAEWQQMKISRSYHAPRTLKVALLDEGRSENSAEAIQAMQAALAEGLASKGIKATFVTAPDDAVASLTVTAWNQGVRVLRYLFGSFGAGEGSIVVLVKSPSADGQTGLDGMARGWVRSGWFGGSSYNAATEAGHLIAEAIATGKTE